MNINLNEKSIFGKKNEIYLKIESGLDKFYFKNKGYNKISKNKKNTLYTLV
jgi:hypothetical protein